MGWDSHLYSIRRSENNLELSTWEFLVIRAEQMAFFNNIDIYCSESSISFLIDRDKIDEDLAAFSGGDCIRTYENCGKNEESWPIQLEESDFQFLAINEKYLISPERNYKYDHYHSQSVKYLTDKVIDAILKGLVSPQKERTMSSLLQLSAFYEFAVTENLIVAREAM